MKDIIRRDAARVLVVAMVAAAPAMGLAFAQEANDIEAVERQPIINNGIVITPTVIAAQRASHEGIILYVAAPSREALAASISPMRATYEELKEEDFPFQVVPEITDNYKSVQMRIIHYGGSIKKRNWNPEEIGTEEFESAIRQEYASDQRARQILGRSD